MVPFSFTNPITYYFLVCLTSRLLLLSITESAHIFRGRPTARLSMHSPAYRPLATLLFSIPFIRPNHRIILSLITSSTPFFNPHNSFTRAFGIPTISLIPNKYLRVSISSALILYLKYFLKTYFIVYFTTYKIEALFLIFKTFLC